MERETPHVGFPRNAVRAPNVAECQQYARSAARSGFSASKNWLRQSFTEGHRHFFNRKTNFVRILGSEGRHAFGYDTDFSVSPCGTPSLGGWLTRLHLPSVFSRGEMMRQAQCLQKGVVV